MTKNKTLKRFSKNIALASMTLACFMIATPSNATFSPQSQALINQVVNHSKQASDEQKNSYFFTLGNAYVTNPVAIGRAIFEVGDANFSVPKFTLANDPYLTCKLHESECFHAIFNQSKSVSAQSTTTADDNDFILNRYYQFLQNPPAVTLAKDIIKSPLPNYSYILAGQRLSFLHNLKLANAGKTDLALQNSLGELKDIRTQFAQADTLLGKSVFHHLLITQLREIVLLKTHFNIATTARISPLTSAEKDMNLVFANEFYAQIVTLEQATKNPKPKLYQHDESINAIAEFINKEIHISSLSASKFAQYRQEKLKNPPKTYPIETNKVANYTGWMLANMATPDYQAYTERMLSTDNLINITNFVLSDEKVALNNAFFPNTKSFTKTDNQICMSMPTFNSKNENYPRYACLFTK